MITTINEKHEKDEKKEKLAYSVVEISEQTTV